MGILLVPNIYDLYFQIEILSKKIENHLNNLSLAKKGISFIEDMIVENKEQLRSLKEEVRILENANDFKSIVDENRALEIASFRERWAKLNDKDK